MLAIEYKGIASAIPDLLSGRVDLILNEVALLAQHSAGGSIRVLAIADTKRAARLPSVPTTAEQGFARVITTPWYGLLAPAGTPRDIIAKLRTLTRPLLDILLRFIASSLGARPP